MDDKRFSAALALAGLKDFQQRSVEYVFGRLYDDADPTPRFLIADEVGLGKTLVARGVIAKALERLQDKVDRVDVVYICSNAAIAKQNVSRLNVGGGDFSIATRLTYLPRQVRDLRKNKVNFISLTPQTALDHTRSREGQVDERAILYRILHDHMAQDDDLKWMCDGLLHVLQGRVNIGTWTELAFKSRYWNLDEELSAGFCRAVREDADLWAKLEKGCSLFAEFREADQIPAEDWELRWDLIGNLRAKLASSCLSALEPDLIILDEFQRFKYLLDQDDEASMLATELFKQPDARILLLSATPYKMYTLDQEADEEDHYPDFLRTLDFLFDDPGQVEQVTELLSQHRAALRASASGAYQHPGQKAQIEEALLRVMCRTERVATTQRRDAMLEQKRREKMPTKLDIQHAKVAENIASCLGTRETIEYWKSLPYLVNFLKHYELRKRLDRQLAEPSEDLHKLLPEARKASLKGPQFRNYRALDPASPRMRALMEDTLEEGMWRLLWMPPSLPYSEPSGAYKGKDKLTKALVFSSWSAVPDAIASICSYEAERRMLGKKPPAYGSLHEQVRPLLRFAVADGRPTGMPVVAWMLPSPTLATAIDPLQIAAEHGDGRPSPKQMRAKATAICRDLLKALPDGEPGPRADQRWYWAAPILLDSDGDLLGWCEEHLKWEALKEDHSAGSRFRDHVEHLIEMGQGEVALGPKPSDLAEVLGDLALAGPGTCALRALHRIRGDEDIAAPGILSAAHKIASGFRTLFNMPESIALLRGSKEARYWRRTLRYGIDGNLQAMLDEYVHTLKESLGLQEGESQAKAIADHIHSVLTLRTAQIRIDELKKWRGAFSIDGFNVRSKFALRFGDFRGDSGEPVRADSVRSAFNSPFRPFVLASTSIGQEGLDFHTWCHAVVHWNLPPNPVDLEQREGRVHRYKGHAIRKNIAEKYGLDALLQHVENGGGDPWDALFQRAAQDKPEGESDLIPYWIFEGGSAKVERRIPLLPYSKEIGKLERLKKSLALYRMVFGQPRQEELLANLSQHDADNSLDWDEWLISLEPPEK